MYYIINLIKTIDSLKEKSEDMNLLISYRSLSLLITSLFYLIGDTNHSIGKKFFIIISITISSIILTYLYTINNDSKKKIKILLFIETIGNCFILVPSGGVASPYLWYALNTLLIAAIKLSKKYIVLNLSLYLATITVIMHVGLNKDTNDILGTLKGELNLILSFILIALVIQRLSKLIKDVQDKSNRIEKTNNNLSQANIKVKESMEHIMTLYKTIHSLSDQRKEHEIIDLLINYTKKITKSNVVFFRKIEKNTEIFIDRNNIKEASKELQDGIIKKWNNILDSEIPIELNVQNRTYIVIRVSSNCRIYGVMGLEVENLDKTIIYEDNMEQLKLLSKLASIALERSYLETVKENLLITEEQNRIANEIHDSVLQRLFSMSCGIFSLIQNLEKLNTEQMKSELNIMRKVIDKAMKELRATIYGMSWNKNGVDAFKEEIISYINEVKSLNNVDVSLNILGDQQFLTSREKKTLYRIICEGIGNGIRHGRANNIKVNLSISSNETILKILDNGKGFKIDDYRKGLGLGNIYHLSEALNGKISIDSTIGEGTVIVVIIPNSIKACNGKEGRVV